MPGELRCLFAAPFLLPKKRWRPSLENAPEFFIKNSGTDPKQQMGPLRPPAHLGILDHLYAYRKGIFPPGREESKGFR